jgi:thioesterase domain-containing protein
MTVFVAKEQSRIRPLWKHPSLGWEEIAPGRVTVITVPGNHIVLMAKPYVNDLAAALNASLKQARDKQQQKTS